MSLGLSNGQSIDSQPTPRAAQASAVGALLSLGVGSSAGRLPSGRVGDGPCLGPLSAPWGPLEAGGLCALQPTTETLQHHAVTEFKGEKPRTPVLSKLSPVPGPRESSLCGVWCPEHRQFLYNLATPRPFLPSWKLPFWPGWPISCSPATQAASRAPSSPEPGGPGQTHVWTQAQPSSVPAREMGVLRRIRGPQRHTTPTLQVLTVTVFCTGAHSGRRKQG